MEGIKERRICNKGWPLRAKERKKNMKKKKTEMIDIAFESVKSSFVYSRFRLGDAVNHEPKSWDAGLQKPYSNQQEKLPVLFL